MRLDPFYIEYCFIGNNVIMRFQCITMKVAFADRQSVKYFILKSFSNVCSEDFIFFNSLF